MTGRRWLRTELACYHESSRVDESIASRNPGLRSDDPSRPRRRSRSGWRHGRARARRRAAAKTRHSLWADYQELFKVRVTSMVVLTAWAGFYLGSMRSGITSMHWGLVEALLGITLVSCGASALNQVIERKTDAKMIRTAQRPLAAGRVGLLLWLGTGPGLFRRRRAGAGLVYQPGHGDADPADRVQLCRGLHPAQALHHAGYVHRRLSRRHASAAGLDRRAGRD